MKKYFSVFLFLVFYAPLLFAQTEEPKTENEKVQLDLGGALRFNYNYSSWKPNQKKRGGDFGFEVFRINVDAVYKKWEFKIDQRFYVQEFGGAFLKYGWFQYNLKEKNHLKLGLIPAYFGIQQFNSHSWFFNLPFYLGFEDDHDMGLSYDYENKDLQLDVGFYKNAETLTFGDNNPISDSRYSYDFSGRNREINQFNLRFNYKYGKKMIQKLGTSIQYGGIWNLDTQEVGDQFAIGLQYEGDYKNLNIKAQAFTFNNRPKNAPGESRDSIQMTAYGAPYYTAAKGSMYSFSMAYTFPVKWGPISALQVYNDYTYFDKARSDWEDTQMNITGVLISAKPVYIYVDFALGKNQPWLGPQWTNALVEGDPNNSWESRFNINFGYYY